MRGRGLAIGVAQSVKCAGPCVPQAVAGIPKIEVTLKLVNERTLRASATYLQGDKMKSLVFASVGAGGKPLRAVADVTKVPK